MLGTKVKFLIIFLYVWGRIVYPESRSLILFVRPPLNQQSYTLEEKKYPVLSLRDVVVFPHMVIPLFVGREKSIQALDAVMGHDQKVVLLSQKDPTIDNPTKKDLYSV